MSRHSHLNYKRMLTILAAGLLATVATAQTPETKAKPDGNGEFSAHGSGIVRVELEAKLRVPLEKTDIVWQWLQERYADCSWLDQEGHSFTAALGDEQFTDVYFDTPDLKLVSENSGVRHRSRLVHSGSADSKDGRQLLQIKLNRNDPTGLGRSEIKYKVAESKPRVLLGDDNHPLLGLLEASERDACKQKFGELNLDPYSMRPILTVLQDRKRVYLSDQSGAFATITLDLCTCDSWGADLRWTEIELELNEIRYTEANAESRTAMERYVGVIQSDLQKKFPDIVQDQTPKYTKAFVGIESGTSVPIRRLIELDLTYADFVNGIQVVVLAVIGLIVGGLLWIFRAYFFSESTNQMATVPRPPQRKAAVPREPAKEEVTL